MRTVFPKFKKEPRYINKERPGFTLIEIMLVITIIGVLMMVLLPQLTGRSVDSRIASTRVGLAAVAAAIGRGEMDMGVISTTDLTVYTYTSAQLIAAGGTIDPDKGQVWNGPYLAKKQLIDAWKTPFKYKFGSHNPPVFGLYSYGPNKQDNSGVDDDILYVP